jgi:nucleoside-diphosphate-sugar epimerase
VYISNIDKLKAKMNWQPKVALEEGLEHLLSWAKANVDLFG